MDCSGIIAKGDWKAHKNRCSKRRVWRRTHVRLDEGTPEVQTGAVITANVGDAPIQPALPGQVPLDSGIGSVIVDGAYGSCKCYDMAAEYGVWAVTPTRRNAKPDNPTPTRSITRNEATKALRYLGRVV